MAKRRISNRVILSFLWGLFTGIAFSNFDFTRLAKIIVISVILLISAFLMFSKKAVNSGDQELI